ncbi:elongation factor P 5-aminopentanone reductase [Pediococcus cellicola]|uniref:3-oxoacyl-acyl carrier protein reductase n=1 Tax=Pediococcus cellicola TaxID=319652 RepID=A0A0R2IS67_9LACO|nr:SDR family oxidoreductase [Pediococcus cellicola]KRN65132.1 3-oxoacyl-acyl carrier protein reductase [Pediococcus cellicola]GEL15821.1 3-oxoacyl-ACP reductase [Pediococcus cellicola]
MKHALILGASGDIGKATAKQLAASGWSLYLHYYHNQTAIQKMIKEFSQKYPKQDFLGVHLDMRDTTSLSQLYTSIFELDALIFAQGTTNYQLLTDTSSEDLQNLWMMQVGVPIEMIKKFQAKLAQSKNGRIIFVGSVYGAVGSAMEVGYSTIKGAQTAFANAYAKEVGSLGITVNVVAPGAVNTQMNRVFSDTEHEQVSENIPLGRFATPDEIAYWLVQLTQKQAGYLTGQTIYVDGGWLK